MAEFKPRSSEGGDDSEDKEGSFVQNWLEKMVDDGEPHAQESDVDTKKKKRFGKLFKPVFRMLFPRNESTSGVDEVEPKKSIFGANILGISKDVDPDEQVSHSNTPEESNSNTVSISHEEPQTDIKDANLYEKETESPPLETKGNIKTVPLDNSEEDYQTITATKTERLQEIGLSSTGKSESSIGYSEQINKSQKTPSKNEMKSSKDPSTLTFIASEFSARRKQRKLERAQKKTENKQKKIEQDAKDIKTKIKANSKKIYETVKREIKKEVPKYIHENKVTLNQKETLPVQKSELTIVKEVQSEKQEEAQTKKVETSPATSRIVLRELEKRELEKQEIDRVINSTSEEIEKEEKTERYFETRQEVKDYSQPRDRAKYYSKPSQAKSHDAYNIQSKVGIPINRADRSNSDSYIDQKNSSQITQQLEADPGKIIATIFLGIIFGLIIIKFLLT